MLSEIRSNLSHRRRFPFLLVGTNLSSWTKRTGGLCRRSKSRWVNLIHFSMTAGAQQALRRTMEIYANTTRFALACNMSSKIIEPIQSRCAILRYAKLKDQEVLQRLLELCEAEKVGVPKCRQLGPSLTLAHALGSIQRRGLNSLDLHRGG